MRARWRPARRLTDVGHRELATVHEALGDAWNRAGEFGKAIDAYVGRPPSDRRRRAR